MYNVPTMKKFQFISDAGHGWLRVSRDDIRRLNIASQITGFSYLSKDAYLEEDCDAGTFIRAWCKANGFLKPDGEPDFQRFFRERCEDVDHGSNSWVRNLRSYNALDVNLQSIG